MEDKDKKSSIPSNEEKGTAKSEASQDQEGTESEEINVEPSQDDGENGSSEIVIDKASQKENAEPTQVKQPVKERNIQAEEGKMSKLERQVNELSQYQRDMDMVNKIYQNNPKAYETFRQAYKTQTGSDLGSYEDVFGVRTPSAGGVTQVNVSQPVVTPQAIETFRAIARRDRENEEGFKEFVKNVPEMNPDGFKSQDEFKNAEIIWNKIGPIADALRTGTGMSAGNALIRAYYSLPENEGRQIKNAEDKGRLIGRAEAYARGVGSDSLVSGQSGMQMGIPKTVKLNDEQMRTYKRFKDEGRSDLARKFAENVSRLE